MKKLKRKIWDYLKYRSHLPVSGFFLRGAYRIYRYFFPVNPAARDPRRLPPALLLPVGRRLEKYKNKLPRISVVMPVFNTPVKYLDSAIASVWHQIYGNWELCIGDDGSSKPAVIEALKRWGKKDERIKVFFSSGHVGISGVTNEVARLATGDYLVFMDHDDLLTADALAEVAWHFLENPKTEFLYSDNDKIDIFGHKYDYEFKPDWSGELLLSYKYFGHLCAVSMNLFKKLGGLRPEFDGVQDFDFSLRVAEMTDRIGHLPLVLYHWRAVPGSAALSGFNKKDSLARGQLALEAALKRRGIKARAAQPDWARRVANSLFNLIFPNEGPAVTLVIPYLDNPVSLKRCLDSLRKTTYKNYKIMVVLDGRRTAEKIELPGDLTCEIVRFNEDGRLSLASLKNKAARQVTTEFLLFFNGHLLVANPEWLSSLMGYAGLEKVAGVGPKIIYPDGTICHAGILRRADDGWPVWLFQGLTPEKAGVFYTEVSRNYLAVTGDCFLTRTALFLEAGGYDEQNLPDFLYDVDFCFRMHGKGWRLVYCPLAVLVRDNFSEDELPDSEKLRDSFRRRYAGQIDPYNNPNYFLKKGLF